MSALKVVKRVAGQYDVRDGRLHVGEIVCDGRPGVDNYPWTWTLSNSVRLQQGVGARGTGVADTKRNALHAIASSYAKRADA